MVILTWGPVVRLRQEIYEKGNSRDVEISIEKFLGRKQSIDPFLEINRNHRTHE